MDSTNPRDQGPTPDLKSNISSEPSKRKLELLDESNEKSQLQNVLINTLRASIQQPSQSKYQRRRPSILPKSDDFNSFDHYTAPQPKTAKKVVKEKTMLRAPDIEGWMPLALTHLFGSGDESAPAPVQPPLPPEKLVVPEVGSSRAIELNDALISLTSPASKETDFDSNLHPAEVPTDQDATLLDEGTGCVPLANAQINDPSASSGTVISNSNSIGLLEVEAQLSDTQFIEILSEVSQPEMSLAFDKAFDSDEELEAPIGSGQVESQLNDDEDHHITEPVSEEAPGSHSLTSQASNEEDVQDSSFVTEHDRSSINAQLPSLQEEQAVSQAETHFSISSTESFHPINREYAFSNSFDAVLAHHTEIYDTLSVLAQESRDIDDKTTPQLDEEQGTLPAPRPRIPTPDIYNIVPTPQGSSVSTRRPHNKLSVRERKRIIHSPNRLKALTQAMRQWLLESQYLLDPFRENEDCWLHPSPPPPLTTAAGLIRPVGALTKRFTWSTPDGNQHSLKLNYGICYKIINRLLTKQQQDGWINKRWHLSHLCGNWVCLNPKHTTVEEGRVNAGRNNCFSHRSGCGHDPVCMKELKILLGADGREVDLERVREGLVVPDLGEWSGGTWEKDDEDGDRDEEEEGVEREDQGHGGENLERFEVESDHGNPWS